MRNSDASMPFAFVYWLYGYAPRKIVEIWARFLRSNAKYFSIGLLFQTLFDPWHRDSEGYGRGFDFDTYMHVFGLNLASRGIGFVIRAITILIALVIEMFLVIAGSLFLFFWFVSPFVVLISVFAGFHFLFLS